MLLHRDQCGIRRAGMGCLRPLPFTSCSILSKLMLKLAMTPVRLRIDRDLETMNYASFVKVDTNWTSGSMTWGFFFGPLHSRALALSSRCTSRTRVWVSPSQPRRRSWSTALLIDIPVRGSFSDLVLRLVSSSIRTGWAAADVVSLENLGSFEEGVVGILRAYDRRGQWLIRHRVLERLQHYIALVFIWTSTLIWSMHFLYIKSFFLRHHIKT